MYSQDCMLKKNNLACKLTYLVGILLMTSSTFAASLDSPAAVTDSSTAMYTIEDLYNRLHDGTTGIKRSNVFTEPSSGPSISASDHDLNDVMGKAPQLDNSTGADVADVLLGKKFWGLKSGVWGLQTGTNGSLYPAAVSKTGQVTCFDVAGNPESPCVTLGQDGDLQKGVANPVTRFTNGGDGTIFDNSTGLTWLKNTNCANATRTWSDALSDINSLNASGTMNSNPCGDTSLGGSYQTDWRLPNVKELYSLMDYAQSSAPLLSGSPQPFDNVQGGPYWSSTTRADDPVQGWVVQFTGHVSSGAKINTYYVWPVRGGQ